MTLDDLLEMGEAHARSVLLERKQKSMVPFYHLVTPPGFDHAVVLANWNGEAEKRAMIAGVKELARKLDTVAALWAGEAWVAKYDLPPGAPRRPPPGRPLPSQDPNRIEVVFIVATDGDETKARLLNMKRGESGRVVALVNEDPGKPVTAAFGRLLDGIVPPKTTTRH